MADKLNFAGGDVKLQWVLLWRSILGMFLTTKYIFFNLSFNRHASLQFLHRYQRFQLT